MIRFNKPGGFPWTLHVNWDETLKSVRMWIVQSSVGKGTEVLFDVTIGADVEPRAEMNTFAVATKFVSADGPDLPRPRLSTCIWARVGDAKFYFHPMIKGRVTVAAYLPTGRPDYYVELRGIGDRSDVSDFSDYIASGIKRCWPNDQPFEDAT